MTVAASAAVFGTPPRGQRWLGYGGRQVARLDTGWRFLRDDAEGAQDPAFDDSTWESVTLPHSARVEALVTGPPGTAGAQWQGRCWYRRRLRIDPGGADDVLLRFEGAMNVAEVWLDGDRIGGHLGGYLPFVLDLGSRRLPLRSPA